jgi:hypothetical protein
VPEADRPLRDTNMKANQKPRRPRSAPQVFEFLHRRPQNILRVENHETGVRIRATRDNFSECDKAYFVRYLGDEGFISDRYRWSLSACSDIEWHIEDSCERAKRSDLQIFASHSRANVFMIRLLSSASLLWLIQLAFLFLWSR